MSHKRTADSTRELAGLGGQTAHSFGLSPPAIQDRLLQAVLLVWKETAPGKKDISHLFAKPGRSF